MRLYELDPTQDRRWAELVERHPKASIFHTVAWLDTLRHSYAYEPVAFTTSPPSGELKSGLVFCRVNSWLTGRRLVSLPFSDYCEPLCDSEEDVSFLIRHLQNELKHQRWKYLELRSINGNFGQTVHGMRFLPAARYLLHTLSLRPDLNRLFRGFDRDSVQRRIQRADQAGLIEKCGRSDDLLKEFYALFVITRGRHRLPPTPYGWFRNLIQRQGKALEIRIAYKNDTPVAAILTLRFRDVLYYKYGCSDARFKQYGATPWLFWRAIAAGKSDGAMEFDLGRTEEGNAGLLAFKNNWVPQSKELIYWRFPQTSSIDSNDSWKLGLAKRLFSYLPPRLLTIMGRLIYRHIG